MAQTHDPVEELWKQVESLAYELGTALADVNEMWAEISGMFGVVLYREDAPPALRADYLMGSLQQLEYMKRTTALLQVPKEINERNKRIEFQHKLANLKEAFAGLDQDYAINVFEPATAKAFLDFKAKIDAFPRNLKELQSSVLVAVYSPIYFILDAFSGYLDKPRPSAEMFELVLKLAKDASMHFLKEAGTILGLIEAIAKAAHDHSEGRFDAFQRGVEQQILHQRLQDSVNEGVAALGKTEEFVANWRIAEDKLNLEFDHAVERCTEVMKFLSKDRANQKKAG
jgi:hypothetical protein